MGTYLGSFPPGLKRLLEDDTRIKCGVNIKSTFLWDRGNVDDAARLLRSYGIWPAGLLELGRFAHLVDPRRLLSLGVTRKIISLDKLARVYLEKPLEKELALTNWGGYLTPQQKLCSYFGKVADIDAANDCYAVWKIFQVLDRLRQDNNIEMPALIDYKEECRVRDMIERLRRMRALVTLLKIHVIHCHAFLDDLGTIYK